MILVTGRSKGFTLIEIMISVAILSFGLILILQGFTHSLNILRISQNNLQATLLAEEEMSQLQIDAKNSKYGLLTDLNGESQVDNIEFSWQTSITPDEEYEDLNKLLTTVSWKEGRRKGAVPVVTYLRTPIGSYE
jgi:prepilin-type N-terminal cleavage/methylation domain-containing protein